MALKLRCKRCGGAIPVSPIETPGLPVECRTCGKTYAWRDGVLVLDVGAGRSADYLPDTFDLIADLETRHFWFDSRNRVILSTLRREGARRGQAVFDVGCGIGTILKCLEDAGLQTCGLDMHFEGLKHARRRLRGLLVQDAAADVAFDGQFDWVLLCDVIEHAADDVRVLQCASRALKSDGALVVTVPASPNLWSIYDEATGHKRRYTQDGLRAALGQAGLRIRSVRYFNACLWPLEKLQRCYGVSGGLDKTSAARTEVIRRMLRVPPGPLNAALRFLTRLEGRVAGLHLPFGTSLIAVAKPNDADRRR